jgi:hypothetical protein
MTITFEGWRYRIHADGSVFGQVVRGSNVMGEVVDPVVVALVREEAKRQRRNPARTRRVFTGGRFENRGNLHPRP